jgi:hypothetical protein
VTGLAAVFVSGTPPSCASPSLSASHGLSRSPTSAHDRRAENAPLSAAKQTRVPLRYSETIRKAVRHRRAWKMRTPPSA